MAKTTNPKRPTKETHRTSRRSTQTLPQNQKDKVKQPPQPPPPPPPQPQTQPQPPQQIPSWAMMKSIFTCKHLDAATEEESNNNNSSKKSKKMRCSGSLCSNTKVMQRPEPPSPEIQQRKSRAISSSSSSSSSHGSSSRSIKTPLSTDISSTGSSRSTVNGVGDGILLNSLSSSTHANANANANANVNSSANYSMKGMPFRRLSGCYECRMVVDPVLAFTRDPSLRTTIFTCPHCGELFMRPERLELHQAVRHAVSELGEEDTSKNIVEIIFQSSWLRKQTPVCQIHRILKVHNTQKTIAKFEEYRDSIKSKATKIPKKHPRCIADGNELLRFHSTTFMCTLGLNGSSNLCNSIPHCNVCSIIKNGFKLAGASGEKNGILTTATSGRAHHRAVVAGLVDHEKRAMLVCRVIAGRVKKTPEGGTGGGSSEEYDSVAGAAGVYSNLDELYVINPKAILPCFVVIYGGF